MNSSNKMKKTLPPELMEFLEKLVEVKVDYPFSRAQTVDVLTEPVQESWETPLVKLSHALLRKLNIVDEPFMLSGPDGDSGGFGCYCYYASVKFEKQGIAVYENFGQGGMCPTDIDHMVSFMRYPAHLKELMPLLLEKSEEMAAHSVAKLEKPTRILSRNELFSASSSPSP